VVRYFVRSWHLTWLSLLFFSPNFHQQQQHLQPLLRCMHPVVKEILVSICHERGYARFVSRWSDTKRVPQQLLAYGIMLVCYRCSTVTIHLWPCLVMLDHILTWQVAGYRNWHDCSISVGKKIWKDLSHYYGRIQYPSRSAHNWPPRRHISYTLGTQWGSSGIRSIAFTSIVLNPSWL
jgi:hypothetical protein